MKFRECLIYTSVILVCGIAGSFAYAMDDKGWGVFFWAGGYILCVVHSAQSAID